MTGFLERHAARGTVALNAITLGALALASPSSAQRLSPEEARTATFPPLIFEPPEPTQHELTSGIQVFFYEDHSLPLVSVFARFRGGPSLLPRSLFAAASAVPLLLRTGGTQTLPPDSLEGRLEFYAIQTAFGGGGENASNSFNTLSKHFREALELWADIARNPGFDSAAVEIWRGRELEDVRRRDDSPGRIAIATFNELLYGDHPVGWQLDEDDLLPERLSSVVLHEVHQAIFCRENLVLGVVGDVTWQEAQAVLNEVTQDWPSCTGTQLQAPPAPDLNTPPGVYLVPRNLPQSTVILGHSSPIRLGESEEYFASRIGNAMLGGAGLSSRLMRRVRTEAGLAYGASSVWTTPMRSDGIIAAVTQTRAEATVDAIELLQEILVEIAEEDPSPIEVEAAINRIANGFVFNFQTPAQVVARQMIYLAQGLPPDWLETYLEGVQGVDPESVRDVFQKTLRPTDVVILVVGDPTLFGAELERFGPVTILGTENQTRNRLR